MMFALVDYFMYRKQRGRYADASLRAQGWMLASQENIQRVIAKGSVGQYFCLHPRVSTISWAIMYLQGQETASHVGTIVENGYIVEALVSSGVVKRAFDVYADGRSYFIVSNLPLTEDKQAGIAAAAEKYIGAPYGFMTLARLAVSTFFGWDRWHKGNYFLHGDVLIALLGISVPSLWVSSWPRIGWYAIAFYILAILTGRIRRLKHVRRQQSQQPGR